jgi:hypothetical protein
MFVRDFLTRAARATLFFYGVLVIFSAVAWWHEMRVDVTGLHRPLIWPFVLGMIGGFIVALARRPSLRVVAQIVDGLGGTRDRLLTALDFSARSKPAALEGLAVEESSAWLGTRDFRPLLPIRPPQELRWLAVPLAMLALLWWDSISKAAARDARAAAAMAEVSGTVRQLEDLAKQVEKRAAATDDETLKKITDRLKQAAGQLRAEAERGGEANKTALRELAKLEQLVKELQRPDFATSDELKSLADALAKHEQTKDAAKDIAEGKLADASKKLQDAAQQPDAAKAQESVKQALDHLARRKEQISKQLEKLQQSEAGDGERQELLQQLADALNELEQQGGMAQQKKQGKGQSAKKGGGGKEMNNEALKKLLSAIQKMKDQQLQQGEGEGEGEPEPGDGEGEGEIKLFAGNPGKDGNEGPEGPQVPTGKPGSEMDEGTTKDPFGKRPVAEASAGNDTQTTGKLGEGETLSALIPGAAKGDAKAARRYKELTEAAAAAAEDVVTQENIPLGARHLIRRYFEAIRPKQ